MREVRTLTALRGVAALWVVLYHYEHHFASDFGSVVHMGDLAVDLFFTLSGFIMVYVYRDQVRFFPFMIKRVARLYPVHLVTLAAMLAMILLADLVGLDSNAVASGWPLAANLLAIHGWGVLDGLSLNYPSWSISAEFAAYLVFPLIAGPLLRMRLAKALIIALAFAAVCVWVADLTGRKIHLRTFDFSPIRILPEFVLGMMAARFGLETRVDRTIVLILGVSAVATALWLQAPLLFLAATPVLILGLFLWDRELPLPATYLGQISYSLYMVHALVEKAGFTIAEMLLGTDKLPLWFLPPILLIVLAAAAILFHAVEQPGRRMVLQRMPKQTIRRRKTDPEP